MIKQKINTILEGLMMIIIFGVIGFLIILGLWAIMNIESNNKDDKIYRLEVQECSDFFNCYGGLKYYKAKIKE